MEIVRVVAIILAGVAVMCLVFFLLCWVFARFLLHFARPTVIRRKGEEGYLITDGRRITLVLPKGRPGQKNPFLDDDGNLKGFVVPGSGTRTMEKSDLQN